MTGPAYAHFTLCLHGADAGNIHVRRDERHTALFLELDENASLRLDLRAELFGQDRTDEIRRDRDGLLRLAEAATQAARELDQLLPPEVTP